MAVCVYDIVVMEDVICCYELVAELYWSGFWSRGDLNDKEAHSWKVGHFSC